MGILNAIWCALRGHQDHQCEPVTLTLDYCKCHHCGRWWFRSTD